jgi:hypothetical protein
MARDEIGEELAEWGKVALLETIGRTSGRPVRTAVGYMAVELDDAQRAAVITDLILKYGTPAERLGRGPAFYLRLLP